MNFGHWLTQTISVASVTGKDTAGRLTYGAARSVKARVEQSRRMLRRPNGDEVQATHRVYAAEAILINDRIWLPGQNSAVVEGSRTPVAVTSSSDRVGTATLYTVDF